MPALAAPLAALLPSVGLGSLVGVGAAPTLAAAGASFAPWVVPAAMGAASLGGSYLQGQAAKNQAKRAEEQWKENAYPNEAAVNAAATENRGALGQARSGSYQNLASNLAARGFGSGSGIGIGGGANIEKSYLQGIGKMQTDLTRFRNTPQFGMPQAAYPTQSPTGAMLGVGGSMMDKAMGYYMMKNLFAKA